MHELKQLLKEIVNIKKLNKLHHDILMNLSNKETPFHTEIADKVKDMVIEKLPEVIAPLIPEPIKGDKGDFVKGDKGDDGKDYILTAKDKKEIASSIKVPVVEKVIEKVEVIRETPIITNEIKEVAVADTGEIIVEKINELPTDDDDLKIDAKHIKNLPESKGNTYYGASIASVTLSKVSDNSTDEGQSTYTLKPGIPVNYKSSDGNSILYIDETNERVGVNNSTPLYPLDTVGVTASKAIISEGSIGPELLSDQTGGVASGNGTFITKSVSVVSGETYYVYFSMTQSVLYNGLVGLKLGTGTTVNTVNVSTSSGDFAVSLTANTTGSVNLTFTVSSYTSGTITVDNTISVKKLTASTPTFISLTSEGIVGTEMRSGGSNFGSTLANDFIGVDSGRFVSNENGQNLAIGNNALPNLYQGDGNTAIGNDTLALASGNYGVNQNTAIGGFSLSKLLKGDGNTAIGLSLINLISGDSNVAIGLNALLNKKSGSYNTAVGYNAGYSQTYGDYNTHIGFYSGRGVTTGVGNITIGSSVVAASYNQITTGSRNISIGYDVAVPTNTSSDQLVIGNAIYGTSLTGTGSTISTSARIGLLVKAPTATLDILNLALAATQVTTAGLALTNTTAAVVGTQVQISPPVRWTGRGWKTNATAASQAVDFMAWVLPVTGAANPTGTWKLQSSINASAYTDRLVVTSDGNVGIGITAPLAMLNIAQTATALGTLKGIIYTGAVNTNQTLSTEIPSVTLTTAGRQWATGAITLQREVLITAPTYSFVGASTITDAVTLGVTAPVQGTNATLTRSWAAQFTGNLAVSTKQYIGGLTTAPTALLHLAAGTTTAATAPLKFTSGTNMTAAEAGAIEFTTDDLFFTITTGAARKAFILDDGTRLTSGRVPFATTNGRLTDDADMTFATDKLTVTKVRSTYYSSDDTVGLTATKVFNDGAVVNTVTIKDGIITAWTQV